MNASVAIAIVILLAIVGVVYAIKEFYWWMTLTKGRRSVAIIGFLFEMAMAGGLAYFLIRYCPTML